MGRFELCIELLQNVTFLEHKFLEPDIVFDDNVQYTLIEFQDSGFVVKNISDNPPPEECYFYFTRKSLIREVLNEIFYNRANFYKR